MSATSPHLLPFAKMEGCQNDYVVVDGRRALPHDLGALAREACARRAGVGADGLLVVEPSTRAAMRMRMFNVDGSEAEMCGNGLRCAVRFAIEEGLLESEVTAEGSFPITVETGAGVLGAAVHARGATWDVALDMGPPTFDPAAIPTTLEGTEILDTALVLSDTTVRVTSLAMGNPHTVLFVEDVATAPVTTLGPHIETHEAFPARTNVAFVEVVSRSRLVQRTWERGCGETLACGTGACAAAVAAMRLGHCDAEVVVSLRGGDLHVAWQPGSSVHMRGPARRVFDGHLELGGA